MTKLSTPTRALIAALLLSTAVTSGCSWLRKGDRLYAGPVESRPLEVPPDLDVSAKPAASTAVPATASATQAAAAASQGAPGFRVTGTRDAVFERVGQALAGIAGVTVASRAQLLGAFDVNFGGANVLVRVTEAEGGAFVSVVDPRGLPATGDAPRKLIEALRSAIGG
jgi:uncharacterized lipoprotein